MAVVIESQAYCKMLLHAAKYAHCSVNGLLLSQKKSSEESEVRYVDCIPLFHITLGLSPMLEVALIQIDKYCKSENLVISGCYQANSNFRDTQPDCFILKIGEKIAEYFQDSCILMIDNKKLSLDLDDTALNVTQYSDGKWKPKEKQSVVLINEMATLETTSLLLRQRCHRQIIDFDNHLDDISQDWKNPEINTKIEELVESLS